MRRDELPPVTTLDIERPPTAGAATRAIARIAVDRRPIERVQIPATTLHLFATRLIEAASRVAMPRLFRREKPPALNRPAFEAEIMSTQTDDPSQRTLLVRIGRFHLALAVAQENLQAATAGDLENPAAFATAQDDDDYP